MSDPAIFLDHLRRSGLVEPQLLEESLEQIETERASSEGADRIDRLAFISQSLVQRYLLTAWQVRQLNKGRYKGFFLRQYKILGHLGTGGMSTVYLAEHTLMQRRVAIKVLPKKRLGKSIYLQRFIREAQAIATLDHPNIVRAYDIDREGDVHYIVMEYFDGTNLQQLVEQEGALSFERVVLILRQAAEALAHAHALGVVHRDIKPGNILVDKQDNAKLLDLGLALLDERLFEGRISSIQEDTILGTADYLAPEQAIDSHRVDARADIYGLGGVLYFCLTGHPPFPEGSVSKRLLAHQQKEPPSILFDRADTPPDLVALCGKMMSKRPGSRQQSATEVVRELDEWLYRHGHSPDVEVDNPPAQDAASLRQQRPVPEPDAEKLLAGRSKLLSLLKQMEERDRNDSTPPAHESDFSVLGGEVSINLLDSGASSGLTGRGADTSVERRVFDEIRRNARKAAAKESSGETDVKEDPILLALNEIERDRSRTRRAASAREAIPLPRRTQTMASPASSSSESPSSQSPSSNSTAIPEATGRADAAKTSEPPHERVAGPVPDPVAIPPWYRLVPVWFWSLFVAAVFSAVFLAGVLAALIAMLSGRNV